MSLQGDQYKCKWVHMPLILLDIYLEAPYFIHEFYNSKYNETVRVLYYKAYKIIKYYTYIFCFFYTIIHTLWHHDFLSSVVT